VPKNAICSIKDTLDIFEIDRARACPSGRAKHPSIGRMAMDEVKPRYVRVWAGTLASVHEKLGRLAQQKTTESQETYLIPKATDKCNAKIRATLMDIKVLVNEDRGLEQWKPVRRVGPGNFTPSPSRIRT
jgi:hypothetical protein